MKSTQEQFLETARKLFADRGFYGVSIANVADQHGLTKQAVLHHFPTKEKLYGEVLKEIATELHAAVQSAEANTDDPRERLIQLLVSMLPTTEDEVVRTRILTRELLDNKIRGTNGIGLVFETVLERAR
ncbi:MAG: TetR/AcrR family transcriptional regulator [Pseudomonadota bacterium]